MATPVAILQWVSLSAMRLEGDLIRLMAVQIIASNVETASAWQLAVPAALPVSALVPASLSAALALVWAVVG